MMRIRSPCSWSQIKTVSLDLRYFSYYHISYYLLNLVRGIGLCPSIGLPEGKLTFMCDVTSVVDMGCSSRIQQQ
jgi:hypothetical protein